LQRAKTEYGVPVEYDKNDKVYRFKEEGEKVSFPLIWFTPRDVMVLMTLLETFKELPFGIFDSDMTPFKEKLEKIMKANRGTFGSLMEKIKVLPTHFRKTPTEMLSLICEALALGTRMKIKYKDRQKERVTEREISPIQIVRYRDIWYLDAYCHKSKDLRIFSVDRIESGEVLKSKAKKVGKKVLVEFFKESYGIFAGKPKNKAVLKFSPEMTRWVSAEEWHPKQKFKFLKDGSYILEFPYSDERELILDILRYGDDVEVLSPKELRQKVKEKLQNAVRKYSN
ncbi:MAG: WYL domain-containing protein, partial [Acidobacteria bacterium]|nr:WYL domain-containing protein [Acidobacteriota bacterium]